MIYSVQDAESKWEGLVGASVIVQIQVGANICACQEVGISTLTTYLSF
jgi:hypothetical protein